MKGSNNEGFIVGPQPQSFRIKSFQVGPKNLHFQCFPKACYVAGSWTTL